MYKRGWTEATTRRVDVTTWQIICMLSARRGEVAHLQQSGNSSVIVADIVALALQGGVRWF